MEDVMIKEVMHFYLKKMIFLASTTQNLIQQLFDEVRQPPPQTVETMDNNNLKTVLKEFLRESRYVFILDDIWSIETWDAIKIALPNHNCGSRVLLTTRIDNVASTSCRESHVFPEDHLIDWMSTIRLWITEGFVEVKEFRKTLEEVAEAYLYELLNRSLIQVTTRRQDRRIKNCRIHDLLREIILSKSRDQNFLAITEANHADGSTIVKEIGRLTLLRRLGILKLRKEDGVDLCSSVEKLSNLRSLDVTSIEKDEIIDLESLLPPPQFLQQLYLIGRLEKLPQWITSFHGLGNVCLWWSKLRDDPLKSLQDLPNLVLLSLADEAYEGEGLCFKAGRFQRLEYLHLDSLKGLRRLTMEEGTMSRLKEPTIMKCELLEKLFPSIGHLSNLKDLDLFDMSNKLISKLNQDIQDRDYWKMKHIPNV
ncbi:hypothetical protein ACSBR1_034124 [Camellia fascicularis]